MGKTAFLFPGQGAQAVRMGADVYEKYSRARDVYARADELLDFSLTDLCFNGPEEKLNSTRYSQPAILVTSLAILEVVRNETRLGRTQISATAGLSLGEYTALVFAGALRFPTHRRFPQCAISLKPFSARLLAHFETGFSLECGDLSPLLPAAA